MRESAEPVTLTEQARPEPESADAVISQTAQLQALGDLVLALTESRSIGRILSLAGQKLKTLFDPDVVQVWMMGDDRKELHLVLTIVDDEHRLAAVLAEYKIEDLATSSFTSADAVRSVDEDILQPSVLYSGRRSEVLHVHPDRVELHYVSEPNRGSRLARAAAGTAARHHRSGCARCQRGPDINQRRGA